MSQPLGVHISGPTEGPNWEKQAAPKEDFLRVLDESIEVAESTGLPYALIGGIASAVHGRPRWTQDVDIFVRPVDAEKMLEAFDERGFHTQRTNPHWLFKAVRDGVLIDLIFRVVGEIYLDDEIISRAVERTFEGRTFTVVSPEDLIVIKAAVTSEEVPHHWYDALGVIAASDLDWEYLLHRARNSARHVLSLLVFAQANDLVVPAEVVRDLFETIHGPRDA